ncbi:class I SAM-dependent rRNA methyltransferase [Celerinatantimonas diazotrophica]|uniref:SAM-dependent methyltransferase /23S rRNA m(5)C-1962 methyltransferase n=1 Tax=Celerinatantimonas diazotrophica TaxID=412034 RepID=A0A4R1K4Q4_9GAMM|nr:class I SAM-dependent methyltransferase [Celerinatantimonas diazotrophica]TCK59094.1 SAM-dependent methyltransferase /23S rRNA m(5)C-1962 methyltransferase [Celerinatantimonas diazotrophica]CAG9297732.1 Ribosomal RNA large subunit methyltransferase I [Celerinatantimonas diazotrophica]
MKPALYLHPKREKSLFRRHPWIFSQAVDRLDGEMVLGETVSIYSAAGQWLAYASYSPNSQIRARVWSFDKRVKVDTEFFAQKLQRAAKSRLLLNQFTQTNAYRLVAGENDGLPGITIDRYADVLVVQLLSAGAQYCKDMLIEALKTQYPQCCIYERSDVDIRKKEGLEPTKALLHGKLPQQPMQIEENGLKLWINVETGHKTGYYLDQRNNRQLIGKLAQDKRVLNCFSYTGGFGTYALAGGAQSVVNLDVSQSALAIAEQNVALNQLDANKVSHIRQDVFQALRDYQGHQSFDLIVLDPPKFVDSKAHLKRGCRGYQDINRLAMGLLESGGLLATFSCSGLMPQELFQKIVADAALDAGRQVVFIKTLEQAEDHPVAGPYPEGFYLKGFLCQVF